jgi:guanylate kinase
MPPSVEELERRLVGRSTDDAKTIQKRVEKAVYELKFAEQFDIILVNDNLQEAQNKAFKLVSDFIYNT